MREKIYIYDSSLVGLLSAFNTALSENIEQAVFQQNHQELLELLELSIVESSEEKANHFLQKLNAPYASRLKDAILKVWMSEENLVSELYQIIYLTIKTKKNHLLWLNNPTVAKINKAVHKVSCEIHRYKGILRFSQLENNLYLAKFAPDANIILPVSMHFKTRLKDEKWAILDTKRLIATIYHDGNLSQATIEQIQSLLSANFAEEEVQIQKLWKTFFKSIAIPERKNTKLQQQCLPKKYWKYLVELSDR